MTSSLHSVAIPSKVRSVAGTTKKTFQDRQALNLENLRLSANGNVMLVYICVSVVLIWSLSRKEREKLDIKLDSTVFVLARVKEI